MKKVLSLLALSATAFVLFLGGPAPASATDSGEAPTASVVPSGPALDRHDKATANVGTRQLKAPGTLSYRHYWGAKNGQWLLTLSGLPVTAGQAATVSATESDGASNEFVGAARITVHNVAVGNGWVAVRVNVESGAPVHLWLHYNG